MKTLFFLFVLLLVFANAEPRQAPRQVQAHAMAYKSVSSSFNIIDNAYYPFTTFYATNTLYFSIGGNRVLIHEPGTYAIMAHLPCTAAQFRLVLDNSTGTYHLADTTVGKGDGGSIISLFSIISVSEELSWIGLLNPSGHSITIPSSSPSYMTSMVILAVEGVDESEHFPGYAEYSMPSENAFGTFYWDMKEHIKLDLITDTPFITNAGTYLVFYQVTPSIGGQVLPNFGTLTAGRSLANSQIIGQGIVEVTTQSQNYITITTEPYSLYQNPNVGGNKQVYNSMVVLEVTGMEYAGMHTLLPPSGPYSLSSGSVLPLTTCVECTSGIILNANSTFTLVNAGVYLISVRFNVDSAARYVVVVGSSELSSTKTATFGANSQIGGVHLIATTTENRLAWVKVVSGANIGTNQGGSHATPISVIVVLLEKY